MDELQQNFENLKSYLASLENAAVAFSGGVDSSFLLKVASDILKEKAVAISVDSVLISDDEKLRIKNFCSDFKISLTTIKFDALAVEKIRSNPFNRCYYCKKEFFSLIKQKAHSLGIKYVLDGTNADDSNDYRPGIKALCELEILSPLKKFNFTKNQIRAFSKKMNLPNFNLPSSACLASRVCYDEEITEEKLNKIYEAEKFLNSKGFIQCRARLHNNLLRIEVLKDDIEKIILKKSEIYSGLKKIGFDYVTLDLAGYRTGSMNEVLK